jgi:two-component system phosphate regulon sensor histidine kinase PhoR
VPGPDITIGGRAYSPSLRMFGHEGRSSATIVLRDVTDRREAEARRLDFYSIIAHDLRSPLNAMMLRTSTMLRRGLGAQVDGDLQKLQKSMESIKVIIDDFLELARMSDTAGRLTRVDVDLCSVISNVVDELRPVAEARALALTWDAPSVPLVVAGDASRLGQVVGNLIGNALKFTPGGGTIAVSTNVTGGLVETVICDSGPGVPEALLPTLFERFSRAPGQEKTPGSGLGLMIVKQIVEAHGGTVGVESTASCGASFWFRLPLAQRAA